MGECLSLCHTAGLLAVLPDGTKALLPAERGENGSGAVGKLQEGMPFLPVWGRNGFNGALQQH